MIRTMLSFCALFGSLALVSYSLQQGTQPTPPRPVPVELVPAPRAEEPRAAQRPAEIRSAESPAPLQIKTARQTMAAQPILVDQANTASSAGGQTIQLVAFNEGDLRDLLDENPPPPPLQGTGDPAVDMRSRLGLAPTPGLAPGLTDELIDLRGRLRDCLAWYYFRPENVATRSPWGSMHAMLAYGVDSKLIAGSDRVNAIGYLNYNGICNNQNLFYLQNGRLQAKIGVGVQGHAGQYLAMLAQSRVKTNFPIRVDGQMFTVADLIQHEKETCRTRSELTFKLIAFSHYLKSDEKWKANDGQDWDIPRLIKEELAQPINGAACGGSHRLTGFSYAVRKRQTRQEPIEGQWKRAEKFVSDFHEYTFQLQNKDGSFSTDWFVRRAEFGDNQRRLQTTGHIAEWLAFSLTREQLVEPRMVKSINYLTELMRQNKQEKWSIGPYGHALHALAIYDERVFEGQPGQRQEQLAEAREKQVQQR